MATTAITLQDVVHCVTNRSTGKKLDTDAILPFVILPSLLIVATISSTATIVVMVAITMGVLYVYSRPQQKNRSSFFFHWSISSAVTLLLVYLYETVSFFVVTLLENIVLIILMACSSYFFYKMKAVADFELALGSSKGKEYCPMITSDSKHCHICQIEVNERFFHSIWWNCCVFRPNYPYFLLAHVFSLVTLLFATNISLSSVCGVTILFDVILIPTDCSNVYSNFDSALNFVSCVYGIGYAVVITLVLIRQLVVFIPKYSAHQWKRMLDV